MSREAKQRGTFAERKRKAMSAQGVKKVNVQIDPADLESCVCKAEGCGSKWFIKAHRIKMLSSLHPENPTKRRIFADVGMVNVCRECGTEFKAEEQ